MTTQAQTQQNPIEVFRAAINKMDEQFKAVLPAHITVDRFKRTLLTAVQMNEKLLEADRRTLFSAAMRAAQMGLLPDGREGAITYFWNKSAGANQCQFMPMLAGIYKLIRNSGELATIDAQIVHKADQFTYHPGIDEVPVLEADWFGERGDAIGAYAVARMKDGSTYVEIMSKKQIDQVRSVSRSKESGPWVQWWDEMWRKTVTRRLAKRLPLSTDIDGVLKDDDVDLAAITPPAAAPTQPDPAPAPEAPTTDNKPARPSRLAKVAQQAPKATQTPTPEPKHPADMPPEPPPFDEDGVITGPGFDGDPGDSGDAGNDNDSPI